MRGGKLNDPHFGSRMQGEGPYFEAVQLLFTQTARRLGLGSYDRGEYDKEAKQPQNKEYDGDRVEHGNLVLVIGLREALLSKSRRTSGEAFSLSASDADV